MEGASIAGTPTGAVKDGSKQYYSAFLLCWAVIWSWVTFDWMELLYRDQWGRHPWLYWTVDWIENFFFLVAAYILFRGVQFRLNDRDLKIACALLPAVILAGVVPFWIVGSDKQLVRLPLLSVDAIVAIAANFAIGIALFHELHGVAHRAKWVVLVVFVAMALLHVPSSIITAQTVGGDTDSVPRQVIRTLLAMGKIALFFAMFAPLVWFYPAVVTGGRALPIVRWISFFIGTLCSVLLAAFSLYRVFHHLIG
jgi:hypothetical protein